MAKKINKQVFRVSTNYNYGTPQNYDHLEVFDDVYQCLEYLYNLSSEEIETTEVFHYEGLIPLNSYPARNFYESFSSRGLAIPLKNCNVAV